MSNRLIHFELGVVDPARAVKFYSDVFGWKSQKWEGPMDYWLVSTGARTEPGIDGGILVNPDQKPGTVNTIGVESVDAFAEKVKAAGGMVVAPKMAIPGVGWQAYCLDTEGNTFGIHQSDPGAK